MNIEKILNSGNSQIMKEYYEKFVDSLTKIETLLENPNLSSKEAVYYNEKKQMLKDAALKLDTKIDVLEKQVAEPVLTGVAMSDSIGNESVVEKTTDEPIKNKSFFAKGRELFKNKKKMVIGTVATVLAITGIGALGNGNNNGSVSTPGITTVEASTTSNLDTFDHSKYIANPNDENVQMDLASGYKEYQASMDGLEPGKYSDTMYIDLMVAGNMDGITTERFAAMDMPEEFAVQEESLTSYLQFFKTDLLSGQHKAVDYDTMLNNEYEIGYLEKLDALYINAVNEGQDITEDLNVLQREFINSHESVSAMSGLHAITYFNALNELQIIDNETMKVYVEDINNVCVEDQNTVGSTGDSNSKYSDIMTEYKQEYEEKVAAAESLDANEYINLGENFDATRLEMANMIYAKDIKNSGHIGDLNEVSFEFMKQRTLAALDAPGGSYTSTSASTGIGSGGTSTGSVSVGQQVGPTTQTAVDGSPLTEDKKVEILESITDALQEEANDNMLDLNDTAEEKEDKLDNIEDEAVREEVKTEHEKLEQAKEDALEAEKESDKNQAEEQAKDEAELADKEAAVENATTEEEKEAAEKELSDKQNDEAFENANGQETEVPKVETEVTDKEVITEETVTNTNDNYEDLKDMDGFVFDEDKLFYGDSQTSVDLGEVQTKTR